MPQRAFIGDPSDQDGNAVSCAFCDRLARMNVAGHPCCSRHAVGRRQAAEMLHQAAERRRAEKRWEMRTNA